jgi:hypothetical protein
MDRVNRSTADQIRVPRLFYKELLDQHLQDAESALEYYKMKAERGE